MPYETNQIMTQKAKQRLTKLESYIYRPVETLAVTAWVTREPVPYAERKSGKQTELKTGGKWGELWDCAWFHFRGEVPKTLAGSKVVLLIDISGELCLVDKKGVPYQGLTNVSSGFDYSLGRPGKRVVDVSPAAKGGETIDLWGDGGCNDLFGEFRSGTLQEACIAVCNEEARSLYYDLEVLIELAEQLPETSARKARVLQAVYDAANLLAEINDETVRLAKERVSGELAMRGGDPVLTVSAIGHAHIDLAWLWPIRETIRKGARTFSTALRNMEKYPDYVFGASQPQLYQWMKEHYPQLYERVKERVREGRWEAQGAMWVEPDTNISGGEALVRQILYGKRFFREEFGQEMKVLWLPDVFGYTGSLPQLLKKSGVDYMMTQKLSWSTYNTHPHHSFMWEGIDGTKVLTHLPPEDTYNSPAAPRSLAKIERSYLDRNVSGHALMLFGIGDGGGGPGEEHLERLAREKNLLGLPPVVQEPALAFFRRLEQEAARFHTYRGELYLEKHQGTLTTQARNKWYNRKLEKALRELEFAASLLWALGGGAYPAGRLEAIWKEVLLYQFHDILPGSSITRVYDESLARYETLFGEVRPMIEETYGRVAVLAGLANEPVLFNSLPWERREWVEYGGRWHFVSVPGMGWRPLREASSEMLEVRPEPGAGGEVLVAEEQRLENGRLAICFHEDGSIASVYDKAAAREVLRDGARANVFTVYHDDGDAWDFPRDYRETVAGAMKLVKVSAFVQGPKAVVKQEYRFGDSVLTQKISLFQGGGTLQFETEADWRESAKMLRVAFPVDVVSEQAICEIQFGVIKRPTSRNNRIEFARDEICAHHYIDLSQPDYGAALLNDSKYGHSVDGNVIDLNLLRSPGYPDPAADRAHHKFTYALYPHAGDFIEAGVYRKGYELNVPLTVVGPGTVVDGENAGESGVRTGAGNAGNTGGETVGKHADKTAGGHDGKIVGEHDGKIIGEHEGKIVGAHGGKINGELVRLRQFVQIDHPNVMVEAVKKAEDSDHLIVRLYETAGAGARAGLAFGFECSAIEEADLLENPLRLLAEGESHINLQFTPFEIKTIRVRL
ncbi:glycoside hydrolase family 38 C-terminal domain-containing protein [Paenibacillus macerans]|uniref:alpha-mannosidase n=1 Tax=Paenibacillus macerans TaxID=44252 RepID=UPI0022E82DAA|nr:glycoside hydrolase family 38 C-terminal domain-containing protein [Paenibacillus macerans]MEC0136743.1 glycoside hydrolase family 38 C-terminal domain-containing protein [Paenibacillus macerans]